VRTNAFSCPNKNRDGKWIIFQPDETSPTHVRMGFYSLWGFQTEGDTRPRNNTYPATELYVPWDSPKKTTDQTPWMVLLADIIERDTTGYAAIAGISSSAPHTRNGHQAVSGDVDPATFGSEGGNVGLVDGPINWRKQKLMQSHSVIWDGNQYRTGARKGYW
jgi:hypothetical protein